MCLRFSRRHVLEGGTAGLLSLLTGCSRDSYGDSTPSFLGVRIGNSADREITAQIIVTDADAGVVWQQTLDLQPHADLRRDTDLHGKTYAVTVILHPSDEAKQEEFQKEWQWQACDEDYIMVQISESDVDVSNECFDD